MTHKKSKTPISQFHWADQPIATWLKSDRRELTNAYVCRSRKQQESVAWATDQLSEKGISASLKIVPFQQLRDERYVLLRPIWITLEYGTEVVTATCYDASAMFGHGDTEIEAIEDLCNALIQCYEDLSSDSDDKLGPLAKQLKNYLQTLVVPKNAA